MRDKWHERHYNDGRTYGQATIAKAVAGTSNHYSDRPIPPVLTLASTARPRRRQRKHPCPRRSSVCRLYRQRHRRLCPRRALRAG